MNSLLWRFMLISAFGRGGRRPLRAAIMRLAVAFAGCAALGLLMAKALSNIPLMTGLPLVWVGSFVALTSYALTGLVLLSLDATRPSEDQDRRAQIINLWPLRRASRWLILALPPIMVGLVVLILLTPVVVELGSVMALPPLALAGFSLAGVAAGSSLMLFGWPRSLFAKTLAFITVVTTAIILLNQYVTHAGHPAAAILGVYVILAASLLGLVQSYWQTAALSPHRTPGHQRLTLKPPLLSDWWFLLKLLRNPSTQASAIFSLTLTAAVALAIHLRHLAAAGGPAWLLFGALLVSAFACDVRGISGRYRVPDIEILKGPLYFVLSEVLATVLTGIVISLPLLSAVVPAETPFIGLIFYDVCLQTGAAMIGLLAGTLLVPRRGDVSAQLFAVIIATSLLLGVPKLAHLSSLLLVQQAGFWLAAGSVCLLIMIPIEYLRRASYGIVRPSAQSTHYRLKLDRDLGNRRS